MSICNKYQVLVLTPATLRFKIYNQTLASFFGKCFHLKYGLKQWTEDEVELFLALHVADVGNEKYFPGDMADLAARYFGEILYYKESYRNNSLGKAFYWLWKKAAETAVDYVFYLEDDWILLEPVDLIHMIKVMENNKNLATLRLNRYRSNNTFTKQWRHRFDWTGEYFKCPDTDKIHIGWCGHPGLVRMGFIQDTLPLIDPGYCPERQMKGLYGPTEMYKVIRKWDYGVYGIPAFKYPFVQDIGRNWRAQHNIIKNADTSWMPGKERANAV